ncbi:EAL domain-containing protein [Marinomonas sp. 15G1-11]|uniref:EAL domain-containing protein n=1 Tax=Marinomonas phaeophyticola TaxID=3004091 RepID=A0ABT4JVI3_9GAMM|nr:GGDEF domain-containing phosphodiesterase [Marinomonas sp. 15G1-11]MCZ2722323.1 EAL domain-containing protein [Marinomonas sp. 15G1-11]
MFKNFIKDFFLISSKQLSRYDTKTFQLSALRIMVVCGFVSISGIVIHNSWYAIQEGNQAALLVNAFYLVGALLPLVFNKMLPKNTARYCLFIVGSSGFVFAATIKNEGILQVALILMYILPTFTGIFFNYKYAIYASFFNLITLAVILTKTNFNFFPTVDISLPFSSHYLHILIFVAFNVALPFAVSRVFFALESNSRHVQSLYRRLNHNSALYEEIFEHTGTPTLLCNRHGKILKANKEAKELLDKNNTNSIENSMINTWMSPLGKNSSGHYFWESNSTECSIKLSPDTHLELHRSNLTTHDHYVLHLQNITHLKALKLELVNTQETNSRIVRFDALTQFANHGHFCSQVNKRLSASNQMGTGAMFIIRISQFKLLNKRYGKDQANRIILAFAKSLQNKMSDQAIIGRLRGVKFACFVPLSHTYFIQRNLSSLIQSILPEQLKIKNDLLTMQYQIGVTYFPADGKSAEDLLEHCEMALEYTNEAERVSYFDHALEEKLFEEHQLGMELNAAIKRNDIRIWLQPQVSPTGQIVSFEALARWQKKDGTFVSPMIFIRIAETLGLLPQLAENLLRELFSILQVWHREKINTPVAFNLAGQELMNDSFFALLMSMNADYPWLSKMLELEITETSEVMTHPLIHKRLRALSQYGFSIAIDDFGTGQASLGQLVDIPANILKIDRRFISPLPDDARHLDIVKSTIQLADSLNMKVIAEGIETKEQANLLISLGCLTLQGYYYGKPTPSQEWTDNNHAKAKELRMVY